MKERNVGILEMLLCAVLWSLSGVLIKLITLNPLLISGGRGLFSAAVIYGYLKLSKNKLKVTKNSLIIGVAMAVMCVFFVCANRLTTAANAIALQYCAPIFILIFQSIIYGKKLRGKEILAVVITGFGILLFFLDQLTPGGILGNIFGLTAGAFMALMFVVMGEESKDTGLRLSGLILGQSMVAVFGIIVGLIMGAPERLLTTDIIYVIILGVVQMGFSYVLFARALGKIKPLTSSLLGMVEPILNPVWVAIIVGEKPGLLALIGAAIVIGCVTWWCVVDSR